MHDLTVRTAESAVVLQAFDLARDYVESRHKSMPIRCSSCNTSYTVADTVTEIRTLADERHPESICHFPTTLAAGASFVRRTGAPVVCEFRNPNITWRCMAKFHRFAPSRRLDYAEVALAKSIQLINCECDHTWPLTCADLGTAIFSAAIHQSFLVLQILGTSSTIKSSRCGWPPLCKPERD
jgi:hypothetical protein